MTEIWFTGDAVDDLRRIGPSGVPKILKKILILEQNAQAGYPLGGELTGFRKLVAGNNTWRIVYRLGAGSIEICEIWAVGARADGEVYAEAVARVRAGAGRSPELAALSEVMERLGRLGGILGTPPPEPEAEPVPDWLADRLLRKVGLAREEVAAMSLQQAVDRWTSFMTEGR